MSAETLRKAAALMRERAEAATPGPWFDNSYSAVISGPMAQQDDDFWTDERLEDGHTYDHRVGQICPACGERPAIYGESAKPEVRGQRFGTYWDCALHKDAYDVDPVVAGVPAQYGDTATGRHRADAAHIASWHPAVALAVADFIDDIAGMWPNGHSICKSHAVAIATAYLGESA